MSAIPSLIPSCLWKTRSQERKRQKKPPWLHFPEQRGTFASGVSRAVSTKPIRTWLARKSLSALHWWPVSWGPRVHILWNLLGSLNILCFGSTRYCLPAESAQQRASRPHPFQDRHQPSLMSMSSSHWALTTAVPSRQVQKLSFETTSFLLLMNCFAYPTPILHPVITAS